MRARETAPERGDGGESGGGNRRRDRDRQRQRWGFRGGRQEGKRDSNGKKEGPNKAGREAVLRGLQGGGGAGLLQEGQACKQEGKRQTMQSRGYGQIIRGKNRVQRKVETGTQTEMGRREDSARVGGR